MKEFVVKFLFLFSFLTSCSSADEMKIEIVNPMDDNRSNEMVEVELEKITTGLKLSEGQNFIISDAEHIQIPYQITYDKKVLFEVDLSRNEKKVLSVSKGTPTKAETISRGRVYPERMDDLAWENDLVGFRAYGPTLQAKGEKAYGYDLFAKRGTRKPVLDEMYAMETDKIAWSEIRALRKEDPEAAEKLRKSVTYHVDKGHGMDCYAVGPTLGAGVAALVQNGEIVYPWCYATCEILDNGPLRFTAKLKFTPVELDDKSVVETRIIQLDEGSHLNHTWISYSNLNEMYSIVSGMVLHDNEGKIMISANKDYMAYEDPTTGPNQGRLYLGHVFPSEMNKIETSYFSKEEVKQRNQARGHLLATGKILPGKCFEYYWGFGWNRADMMDFETWTDYLACFSKRLKHPLQINVKPI